MIELGRYCLLASLLLCGYATVASLIGGFRGHRALVRSGENAALSHFVVILTSSVCLWYLLLTDQFQLEYVFGYSSANQPTVYKFTAFWGGQSGSLLFWALVLAIFFFIAVLQNRNRNRDLMPFTTAVLAGTSFFFMVLLNFATNPFELLPGVPADGQGLNPLLQNWYMTIHPPSLYLGYICLTVPFAFALGALMSGRMDTSWIPVTRKWGLVSWCFLTFGIALGGMWAYEELGWGGYWAWDPVENASFMPWLVSTAFLHSIMITEKKGMLKMWNFILIILSFMLSIFGTFITRSGVISSVHSFALSNLGPFFVVFMAIMAMLSLALLFYRSEALRSELKMQSFLSREASFLLNNWLFVSICFAVFWGTVFPVLSEAVTGIKRTVAAPWFNSVTAPLWLSLLILTGICPLIAWRKASLKNFQRNFIYPITGGLVTGVICLLIGVRDATALAFFSGGGFVALTVFFEFYKGARARQAIRPSALTTALLDLTTMNKRRYGGFIIHTGTILVFVGITASSLFSTDRLFNVKPGEQFAMGDYLLEFKEMRQRRDPEKDVLLAVLNVSKGGSSIGTIIPQKHFHHKSQQPQTEVAIRSTLSEDLYISLVDFSEEAATFRIYINPLVLVIWIGVVIMVLGGLFVLTPDRRQPRAKAVYKKDEDVQHEAA